MYDMVVVYVQRLIYGFLVFLSYVNSVYELFYIVVCFGEMMVFILIGLYGYLSYIYSIFMDLGFIISGVLVFINVVQNIYVQ